MNKADKWTEEEEHIFNLLTELDETAQAITTPFDSAADLREIREERAAELYNRANDALINAAILGEMSRAEQESDRRACRCFDTWLCPNHN